MKRLLDCLVACCGLVVWALLHPFVALAIMLESRGSIFYRQERLGRNGQPFILCKYRTMQEDAEADGTPRWAQPADPRITRVGHWLRRFGLDELPQFWTVLRGEMSVVGPRPERAYFYEKYPELRNGRLSVLPGITGLAQVSHRATATESDLQRKIEYDLRYVREQSLWLDVRIMWRTLTLLLGGRDLL